MQSIFKFLNCFKKLLLKLVSVEAGISTQVVDSKIYTLQKESVYQ